MRKRTHKKQANDKKVHLS